MSTGEQNDIPLDENFAKVFNAMLISHMLDADGLGDTLDGFDLGGLM